MKGQKPHKSARQHQGCREELIHSLLLVGCCPSVPSLICQGSLTLSLENPKLEFAAEGHAQMEM